LTRSVLRDDNGRAVESAAAPSLKTGTILDRAIDSSLRLASTLFADPDFQGHVNFVTTASLRDSLAPATMLVPRGVAYFVVGAPVGPQGDWQVRAAVASGDGSAWNLLGEYRSTIVRTHSVRTGLSYSAQGHTPGVHRRQTASADMRTAAGIFASDRWQVHPWLALDYGAQVDRYDYLTAPTLASGHMAAATRLWPGLRVEGRLERRRLAPGADEFMPPPASGVWLPAERTFSLLSDRAGWRAQDVRHGELSVSQSFGARGTAVHARAFRQRTRDQMAVLFGLRDAGQGHYYVAYVGGLALDGWAIGVSGPFGGPVTGRVEYAQAATDWAVRPSRQVRRAAPSVLRAAHERVHDLTASIDADVVRTATFVRIAFRASSGYSVDEIGLAPRADGRWDIELRQGLSRGEGRDPGVELLFSVRTLARDLRKSVSFYDELLTLQPPTRLMGGIRMRF
jgi:hypothetical protein